MQANATTDNELREIMISTDPPYYDNISYADLSDYFYIWLRLSLKNDYPDLFQTLLVLKQKSSLRHNIDLEVTVGGLWTSLKAGCSRRLN